MISLLAAALLSGQTCSPPAGAEALWTDQTRYVIIGEQHGTTETPAAFAQLVCEAAARGPVTVALEFPETLQPAFDALLAAPDDDAVTAILRETPFWVTDPDYQDGRGSLAMLEMLQSIRRLKADGRDVTIRAFMSSRRRPDGFDQNYHELAMAGGLAQAAKDRPEARVLVLVGSFHAAKRRYFADDFLPAAAHLPPAEVVSLQLPQQGGQSWSCTVDGCGPLAVLPVDDQSERGVILRPVDDGLFDGVLALGPVTASPPAPSIEPTAPR